MASATQTTPEAQPRKPRSFAASDSGGGIFGKWIVDEAGQPAFEYTLDQYADDRAKYPTVERRERRDHWHQIGNDEITALASNDGTVQVYVGHRGGRFLNRFASQIDDVLRTQEMAQIANPTLLQRIHGRVIRALGKTWLNLQLFIRHWRVRPPKQTPIPAQQVDHTQPQSMNPRGSPVAEPVAAAAQILPAKRPSVRHAHAGGFGYVDDGEQVWCTAYRFRPPTSETRRVFGMGYAEYSTTYGNLRVKRRIYPPKDACALLIDVEITNLRPDTVHLRYYEYWDVNVEQLKLQWLRGDPFYAIADEERLSVNDLFLPEVTFEDGRTLRFHQSPVNREIDVRTVNDIDFEPQDIFLHDLSGTPDAYYTDKVAFFGKNPPTKPEAVAERWGTIPDAPSTDSMPYCLVLRRDLTLSAGETQTLRFVYGTNRFTVPAFKGEAALLDRDGDLYFDTGADAALTREMAWHSYYLTSATVYNDYYQTYLTPQGSAYLFIHGADGAPRDQALFTLPLSYIRPDLARANLRLIMALTDHQTGAIPYSFAGYGFHSNAFIHDMPSDLDLFFLLAMNEYLAATRDFEFLQQEVPFYSGDDTPGHPPAALGSTVLDHIRVAVHHLTQRVGIGQHGLVKIGDGDWSDGVVFDTCAKFGGVLALGWFSNSKANGESIPNSQMALYVLPITAALIKPYDAVCAREIEQFVSGLEAAVMRQWNGKWFTRAVLRDAQNKPVVVDNNHINLEAQPWALISGLAQRNGIESTLITSIKTLLDDPSPTGAALLEQGMIWPAVSQLLTWGYTCSRPDLAWRSLEKHTFERHAKEFPDKWINVWSGPDGVNSKEAKLNPGGTWSSAATPMTDFPVMNMNPHAMALLGLLRVCGIEPTPDGLLIEPRVPRERFELDTALLRLTVTPDEISGEYRPIVSSGTQTLIIRTRKGERRIPLNISGRAPIPFKVSMIEFR
ncbi:MAG: hypothetical protein IPO91_31395 [Chloroflexi bacterium]|nr:hypothetical protein [Chloroflexota bacterium]